VTFVTLLAKQICYDYVRLNSCFGPTGKRSQYFHFLQKQSILKIQKASSEQHLVKWSCLWAMHLSALKRWKENSSQKPQDL